jgi:DNA-binding winged helix-turn-helix (wHTH) protein
MEAAEDVTTPLQAMPTANLLRFGAFELDIAAERLLRNGRSVRLQPQPFKLLCLLAGQAGRVVTREDIRSALWTEDTFVDFEQGVNFAIKQVREALGEDAEHPIYIQTILKRGYKFVAPVEVVGAQPAQAPPQARTDGTLSKLLWTHIAELRIAEDLRKKRRRALLIGVAAVIAAAAIATIAFWMVRVV